MFRPHEAVTPLPAPTLLDFVYLCAHLRGDNVDEYLASTFADRFDPDAVALEYAGKPGAKFVYRVDGVPVCAGGLELVAPGVMDAWMLCTERWAEHWPAITRHTRRVMRAAFDSGHVHRIEHRCLASRRDAMRWYSVLGLNLEGIARASGKHGQDRAVFARVRGDPHGRRR